jgi:hypothetical protein
VRLTWRFVTQQLSLMIAAWRRPTELTRSRNTPVEFMIGRGDIRAGPPIEFHRDNPPHRDLLRPTASSRDLDGNDRRHPAPPPRVLTGRLGGFRCWLPNTGNLGCQPLVLPAATLPGRCPRSGEATAILSRVVAGVHDVPGHSRNPKPKPTSSSPGDLRPCHTQGPQAGATSSVLTPVAVV